MTLRLSKSPSTSTRSVDVVKVVDLTEGAHVERDTLLVKVRAVDAQRDEVKRTTEIFRGQIIDVGPTTYCACSSRDPRKSSILFCRRSARTEGA
jgi:acetolactate synthase-1/3 small subunit